MSNRHLKTARTFARIMDNQFSIFGFRFGIDSILGLVPGVGDIIAMIMSIYLIWVGLQMKLPAKKIIEMIINLVIDVSIGTVPILGDVADFIFKANTKNLQILEDFDSNIIDGEVYRK